MAWFGSPAAIPPPTSGAAHVPTDEVRNAIASPKSRAERLLRRTLPPKEWYRYMIKGYVLVRGSKEGLYQLTQNRNYGINQWEPKKRTICTVPGDISSLDPADFIVAQYLALINDEKGFLKKANEASNYRGPSAQQSDSLTATDLAEARERLLAATGGYDASPIDTRAALEIQQRQAMLRHELERARQQYMAGYTEPLSFLGRINNSAAQVGRREEAERQRWITEQMSARQIDSRGNS